MRTLIIAPHMDDEVLGAGVLIQRRLQQGVFVRVVTMMGRRYGYGAMSKEENRQEAVCAEEARKILGYQEVSHYFQPEGEPGLVGYYRILRLVEENLHYFNPTEVVIPALTDLNQDHRHLNDVCRIALRPANLRKVGRVLAMRAFDPPPSSATYYIAHDGAEFEKKGEALEKYGREWRSGFHPRSWQNIEAAHRILGSRIGAEYAEGFDLILQRECHEGSDYGRNRIHRDQSDRVVDEARTDDGDRAGGLGPPMHHAV